MKKNVLVIDTETTSINKPFCYNVGWVVAQIDDNGNYTILNTEEYMNKEVWYNTMLFSTAYYVDKKAIYHKAIRNHEIKVTKFSSMIERLAEVIAQYNIEIAYAYNSAFDERVFDFNTEWFHTPNPLAELPFYDIRAYFMDFAKDSEVFKAYCELHELFTDSGNYSTTAEVAYRYLTKEHDFIESHTALADSIIETEILSQCAIRNENIFTEIKSLKSIPRIIEKDFILKYKDKKVILKGTSATWYKSKNTFVIK